MFKKLRQKIEEEENVPTVFPGKPIRLSSTDSTGEISGVYALSSVPKEDTSTANTEESPRKGSSKGWLGNSLSSMIRGDHQMLLNDLGKEKEKLEAALEKQQDMTVQRMREQEGAHQDKMAAAAQELAASKQELEKTYGTVADLKLQISVFEAEKKESDSLVSRLKEECASLRSENDHLQAEVKELSRHPSISASGMATGLHDNTAQLGTDAECTKNMNSDRVAQDGCEGGSGESGKDSKKDNYIEDEPKPLASSEGASTVAILSVRQRDVLWSEETSMNQSLDEPLTVQHEDLDESDNREPVHWAERVSRLSEENIAIAEELQEKIQLIKVQQQKIADLKRTLQKGLRSTEPQPAPVPFAGGDTSALAAKATATADVSNAVNFLYLKHVVVKFMCSHGEEARYLVKAIAVLLKFTPQEQRLVKEFQDYKVSWFGNKPS